MEETKAMTEKWRRHYNRDRPHSSPGYKTPSEFLENLTGARVLSFPLLGTQEGQEEKERQSAKPCPVFHPGAQVALQQSLILRVGKKTIT